VLTINNQSLSMLTSHKLLYILPEVAYITELLPTKKEHTFAIHAFRQINGEFLDENEFIAENIEKLINKLDSEEYHLILPDFLFTNTIVEVAETDEAKVVEYLKTKLLPELTLSTTSHELKTFVLNTYGGKSKVQLSALEKSLMNPVTIAAKEKGITFSGISPLSWTVKSIVSLEPSISVIQMGSHAYLAQHYIGIDQAISAKVEEIETLSETIKTLKGAEPSIQTVYLITNSLVEEELKTHLSNTLPIQQLASFKEEESEMPSYVKYCIEAGMKTLSIEAFPVPRFPLPEVTEPIWGSDDQDSLDTEDTKAVVPPVAESLPKPKELSLDETPAIEPIVPLPTPVITPTAPVTTELTIEDEASEEDTLLGGENTFDLPKPEITSVAETTSSFDSDGSIANVEPVAPTVLTPTPVIETQAPTVETTITDSASSATTTVATQTDKVELKEEQEDQEKQEEAPVVKASPTLESAKTNPATTPMIIKNQSGIQPMLKMLGVSFLVFLITIGVGIGIGRAFIYVSQRQSSDSGQQSPVTEATPSPSPATSSPSPSPSPSPAVDPAELSVLVVNATTKAGYAGTSKTKLETAKFGEVTASNAKGKYETGTYVLMETENTELVELLEESLGTTLTYKSEVAVEDPQGEYDAVIVLAE
jgi:hypothetical protein